MSEETERDSLSTALAALRLGNPVPPSCFATGGAALQYLRRNADNTAREWATLPSSSGLDQAAVDARVTAGIASWVGAAPGALDTLVEIATQLAADESTAGALATTVAGKLAITSNLGDLASPATARANLGLGTAATTAASAYATAAQGATADAAAVASTTTAALALKAPLANAVFTGTFAVAAGAIASAALANSAVANLSGTNSGDNAANSLYSGLVTNATHTGDVTGSTVLTLATAQPAVHTWALAQTFTVAPVFTDASGTRTALGLGALATQSGTFSGTSSGTNTGDAPASFALGANIGSAATSATTGTMTVNMTTAIVTTTPSGACTFNGSGGTAGQLTTFIVTTSGTTSFVLTFGTNFKSVGTLATGTTTGKIFTVTFRNNGGSQYVETGRTTAM